jgi:hypothetical protein
MGKPIDLVIGHSAFTCIPSSLNIPPSISILYASMEAKIKLLESERDELKRELEAIQKYIKLETPE